MMKKTLIAITLASVIASTTSFAAEAEPDYQPTQQDAGLGIGLLAGAIVGGPIGFVVGGLIGAQVGQAEDYKQQLEEKDQQLATLRKGIALAQARKVEARVEPGEDKPLRFHNTVATSQQLSGTLATGMRVDVLFRTNSENIEPHYTSQLQRIIAVMKLFPEVDIQLAGHADPRGPETDNLALSKRRVNSIRQALVKAGIKNQRIHATAWGERNTISMPKDIEAYAFDRRVVIDFVSKPSGDNKAALQEGAVTHPGGFLPASLPQ
jgi:sortase system peptidoglycan-associated protein